VKANTCGHPERKHQAKGMCKPCYRLAYRSDPTNRERELEGQRRWHAENAEREKAYRKVNRLSIGARGLMWKTKNKERTREITRKSKYGISVEAQRQLLSNHPSCMICDCAFGPAQRPCIDHDHKNRRIRGLLCNKCNQALGGFRDSIELLLSAALYLERQAT
jgi:hypothetical protein